MKNSIKQLIFIDDSGDPGFKKDSSDNFVVAAAVFVDPKTATKLSKHISEFRRSLGWHENYEFKFTKIRKDIIIKLLQIISKYDFKIYAVYIDKVHFKNVQQIIDKEKLYNWVIKELLLTIPFDAAKIEIDGRSSKQNMLKTATYLRREINRNNDKKIEIKFENSIDDNLIQLADLVAGAINRSMNKNKTDSKRYVKLLKNKIKTIKRLN